MSKIVLDVNGADYSPGELVLGAVKAVNNHEDLIMILCGPQQEIEEVLKTQTYDKSRIEIINATDTITNFNSGFIISLCF